MFEGYYQRVTVIKKLNLLHRIFQCAMIHKDTIRLENSRIDMHKKRKNIEMNTAEI